MLLWRPPHGLLYWYLTNPTISLQLTPYMKWTLVINSLKLGSAYIYICVNKFGHHLFRLTCRIFGDKPSPESMLNYWKLDRITSNSLFINKGDKRCLSKSVNKVCRWKWTHYKKLTHYKAVKNILFTFVMWKSFSLEVLYVNLHIHKHI